jgi:very-short-patch-repair endonuclease
MSRLLRPQTYRARQLRRQSTPAETALWELLRGRRIDGAKFRRQQPLGPFIVDFVCVEAWLVVEADGAPHFPKPPHDQMRDHWLSAAGLLVLRLPNHQILHHPDYVVQRIRAALRRAPLPPGEGSG